MLYIQVTVLYFVGFNIHAIAEGSCTDVSEVACFMVKSIDFIIAMREGYLGVLLWDGRGVMHSHNHIGLACLIVGNGTI